MCQCSSSSRGTASHHASCQSLSVPNHLPVALSGIMMPTASHHDVMPCHGMSFFVCGSAAAINGGRPARGGAESHRFAPGPIRASRIRTGDPIGAA
eukprot:340539-Rhodomonas_salina.2